jgi:hypothetical protein
MHEWPYLVKGDKTVLLPGMTFSNEPMICIYGEFGVRLEDHMAISETGARWFTQPAYSVDDPFAWRSKDGRRKQACEWNPCRLTNRLSVRLPPGPPSLRANITNRLIISAAVKPLSARNSLSYM